MCSVLLFVRFHNFIVLIVPQNILLSHLASLFSHSCLCFVSAVHSTATAPAAASAGMRVYLFVFVLALCCCACSKFLIIFQPILCHVHLLPSFFSRIPAFCPHLIRLCFCLSCATAFFALLLLRVLPLGFSAVRASCHARPFC